MDQVKKASETFSTHLRDLLGNIDEHEIHYQELRANGAEGWGAESFHKRMQGWELNLEWALLFFPPAPAKLLDIGCGAGDSALPLAKLGYDVSGLDISLTAIDWAKEKFARNNLSADFKVHNLAEPIEFWPAESFDLIVDSATLHCIIPPEREAAFTNIRRLLKPNGIFLLSSMVGEPKDLSKLDFFDSEKRLQRVKNLPLRYTPYLSDLKEEVTSYGFFIVESKIQVNPWWDHFTAILKIK
ncbi:MAG: class I SAM-dependent methyltransferase [Bdellovibrionota bacterium]